MLIPRPKSKLSKCLLTEKFKDLQKEGSVVSCTFRFMVQVLMEIYDMVEGNASHVWYCAQAVHWRSSCALEIKLCTGD